ncbi:MULTISPECIES: hypothetical protein [Nocardia]|uniref:hypothetical protein n=1 Tax=Nocardia TaxID=1817 RepID=UPI0007E950E3|nr:MULTISPECIES: hypothetical protein [Nocardia]MBF6275791.1 hypothetical protein [Nocardia nova]OBA40675.1 hypothetical protein A5789_17025 [Nocardia sp. 852002-51101_SCH5132738]OBB50009.1 hypothetical protein A5748_18550 [Nocardia sp. 852002-51244_SCH5132740]OBF84608.1 hypothetical protein A9X06_14585 [Mycobacterium sp. 852002-51759_SCH5129042]
MKTTTRTIAVSTLLATAVVAAAGAAQADVVAPAPSTPAPVAPQSEWTSTDLGPGIRYQDDTTTGTAALQTPLGAVAVRPGQFDIRDGGGRTLLGTPIEVPAAADPARPTAPSQPVAGAVESTAAQSGSVADTQMSDLNQAVAAAAPHMGLAMAVGGMAGSVIGAAVGCPLGIATGGSLISVATAGTMTVPAMAAACLVGVVAVGGLGASVGGVAVALPVGIAAGTQKYNQLQAEHAQNAH